MRCTRSHSHSLSQWFNSLAHSLTLSLTHSTLTRAHALTLPVVQLSHSLTHSTLTRAHALTRSRHSLAHALRSRLHEDGLARTHDSLAHSLTGNFEDPLTPLARCGPGCLGCLRDEVHAINHCMREVCASLFATRNSVSLSTQRRRKVLVKPIFCEDLVSRGLFFFFLCRLILGGYRL